MHINVDAFGAKRKSSKSGGFTLEVLMILESCGLGFRVFKLRFGVQGFLNRIHF